MAIQPEALARLAKELFPGGVHPQGDELAELGGYFEPVDVEAGEVLWKEGAPGDSAAFLLDGELELMKATEFGDRQIVLALIGPGSLAGEPCLANGGPRIATARATRPTKLLMLTRDNLNRLLKDHPEQGACVLRVLLQASARRLAQAYSRLSAIF